MKDPGKRFPKKEQEQFKMKLENFVVDTLLKTTTYENNFKHLMRAKNIKKVFPEKSFHGKDETFQYEDGKSLFQEAIDLNPDCYEQKNSKKKEISPGYSLNKMKRKAEDEINCETKKKLKT